MKQCATKVKATITQFNINMLTQFPCQHAWTGEQETKQTYYSQILRMTKNLVNKETCIIPGTLTTTLYCVHFSSVH